DTGGIAGGRDEHGFDPTVISHFQGGDFVGLTQRLDYVKNLGVTAVWVTPPFKNKAVQSGSAGYHGYWITDFLQIDPHLGTNDEFSEFVQQAHARGLRVFLDIIVNHTADVIAPVEGETRYREASHWPYRDATGREFDESKVAYNGIGATDAFPALDPKRSFAYTPVVPAAEMNAKNPAWLNDVTLYHNRGNSLFKGESSLDGDFVGLDDLFTEHPRVVQGFIDIYRHWIESYGVDGFRIDTARHVNTEFWHAFAAAIRTHARQVGRPEFLAFGEVANETGNISYLSEFSTAATLDATLDFGFFVGAREFVSRGGSAAGLAELFDRDDYYTDHDSNVHATTTFVGNHDAGRFGYFLKQDNPAASDAQLVDLMELGHGLLFLARGQPVVYYGDEQGMTGTGNDMQARESMFASRTPLYRGLSLIGTKRTGADDKFDDQHPLYRTIRALATLRSAHPTLARGSMHLRATDNPNVFAFSRVDRSERVEYVVALNNSRKETLAVTLPTSQPPGATLRCVFDSRTPEVAGAPNLATGARGELAVRLEPLQFAVWRAEAPLAPTSGELRVTFITPTPDALLAFSTYEMDGATFPMRREVRAEVTGGDGVAEVTFAMIRSSRPEHYELLGTDEAPPYRVYWRPPADFASGETFAFVATANDLRGRRVSAQVGGLSIAPNEIAFGITGSTVPNFTQAPASRIDVVAGETLTLSAAAEGTAPLEFRWLRDGVEIPGASEPTLTIPHVTPATAGRYVVLVRNRAATIVSGETTVSVREK
ncbi:MAG TPA: alpha-amylase family glycosyl hydrolase, partial [Opitutaceae bacterium]